MRGHSQGQSSPRSLGWGEPEMAKGPGQPRGSCAPQQGMLPGVLLLRLWLDDVTQPRTEEQRARADKKLLRRQEERVQRLKDHGIEYSFGRAAYVSDIPWWGGSLLTTALRHLSGHECDSEIY